jgi:2-polyprenyl-6-methoxyphenol hydroxylase-like FAD-dependent oxidoreductase
MCVAPGGQGMNLGVGDAVNLAWKLALVLKKGADEALLESYNEERWVGTTRDPLQTRYSGYP